jgi:hypothetical protein
MNITDEAIKQVLDSEDLVHLVERGYSTEEYGFAAKLIGERLRAKDEPLSQHAIVEIISLAWGLTFEVRRDDPQSFSGYARVARRLLDAARLDRK